MSWMDAVRDGIAEEMRRDPHIIYFGEGTGDRGGSYGHTKNLFKEFGGDRMIDTPDLRTRLHRGLDRRLGHRMPRRGRPDAGRFPLGGRRPDRAASLEAPLHEQRAGVGADGRSRGRGLGQERRPAPQRFVLSRLGPLPRPDRRRSLQSGRRQGTVQDGLAGERSGDLPRTEIAAVEQGTRADGRVLHPLRQSERRPAGDRSDDRLLRPLAASVGRSGRTIGRPRHLGRSDRPADDRAVGRRNDRRRA